ncbi:MAG: hypothetical protein PSX71_02430 [bacterium]|nr:hypothetical protein [bacterium]
MIKNTLQLLDFRRLGFVAIFLSLLTLTPLIDPDYFWHLRTGQYLFEQGALPASDIFSYTRSGTPWVLHEWLFELLLYGIYSLLGGFGISLLVSVLATATLVISCSTANKILGKPYTAFFLTLTGFILLKAGIAPRPQLVTFLLLAVFLRVLTGFKYFGETRGLRVLPVLMAVWVNFHAGYAIGLALLLLFTACEWVIFLASDDRPATQRRNLQWLSLVAAATVLASLANPYFIGHWLYPFQVMDMEASRSYISEWRSPGFHNLRDRVYLALVFAFFIATIYRKRKADLSELAIPLCFFMMGFVAVRHITVAAITTLPFMAAALAQQPLTQMMPARWRQGFFSWYSGRARKGQDMGDKEYLLNWLLLAFILAGFLLYYPIQQARNTEALEKTMPVAATEFILREGIRGRMFNAYHYGGYLIYRLYPAQPVFIDGRADMYGDAFVREYMEISGGLENWESLFNQYRIDYVLIPRGGPLQQLLVGRGDFKLVYEDKENVVLLRNNEKYAAIIARHPH